MRSSTELLARRAFISITRHNVKLLVRRTSTKNKWIHRFLYSVKVLRTILRVLLLFFIDMNALRAKVRHSAALLCKLPALTLPLFETT